MHSLRAFLFGAVGLADVGLGDGCGKSWYGVADASSLDPPQTANLITYFHAAGISRSKRHRDSPTLSAARLRGFRSAHYLAAGQRGGSTSPGKRRVRCERRGVHPACAARVRTAAPLRRGRRGGCTAGQWGSRRR